MDLNEAKDILESAGYIVESEFDYTEDISREELDAELVTLYRRKETSCQSF